MSDEGRGRHGGLVPGGRLPRIAGVAPLGPQRVPTTAPAPAAPVPPPEPTPPEPTDDDGAAGGAPDVTLRDIVVLERREKVKMLMPRRLTAREIAGALKVSERTIEGDIAAIRHEMAAELSLTTVMDVANDVRRRGMARERELWLLFQKADADDWRRRLAVLRELRTSEAQEVEELQSLGLVEAAPKRVEHDVRFLNQLELLPAPVLAELADTTDPDVFDRRLSQALAEFAATSPKAAREVKRLTAGSEDE